MRRIGWVRIVLKGDGSAVCHLTGTGHRLPIVRRVSLATALSLAAEGVPCVVRASPRQAENHSSD